MTRHVMMSVAGMAAGVATGLTGAGAMAQPTQRAAFVGNNGNLEGSVASYTFDAAGQPVFVGKTVIGARASTAPAIPSTNVAGLSLSPDGRFLAASHTTSFNVTEQLTILRVNADATTSIALIGQTPDSPLDLKWVSNELLAVTQTGTSVLWLYRYDRVANTLTATASAPVTGFMSTLWTSPDGQLIYAPQTTTSTIRVFRVGAGGSLTQIAENPIGHFPLAPTTSPDGSRLYCFGGISGSGTLVGGFAVDQGTGVFTPIAGTPFTAGSSPKIGSVNASGTVLAVGHGTDSTARTFRIDAGTGALTSTGWVFDVGIQGDLGEVAFLDELLLVTDRFNSGNGTGLLAFTLQGNGTAVQNGPVVSSQGPTPEGIAVWSPAVQACYANCDGSTAAPVLNALDFACFLSRYQAGEAYANCDGSTATPVLNALDFACFLNRYQAGCP